MSQPGCGRSLRLQILIVPLILALAVAAGPALAQSTGHATVRKTKHAVHARRHHRKRKQHRRHKRHTFNRATASSSPTGSTVATSGSSVTPGTASVSGQPMPVGDVPGWHQVFADDFATAEPIGSFSSCITGLGIINDYCSGLSGTPYFGTWFAYPDGWTGTPSNGTYYPSQSISIGNGTLDYYLHTASVSGSTYHMIDAAVPKIPGGLSGGGLLYGRYIIRARWDALSSYYISFLLWPDSENWPADGEIDFPEANMGSTDVSAYMHWQGATSGSQQDAYDVYTTPQQWHTYEIDWLPSAVSFYEDGRLVGRSTANVPATAMHWVLQTNTSSSMRAGDTESGHLQVDWAVAYRPA